MQLLQQFETVAKSAKWDLKFPEQKTQSKQIEMNATFSRKVWWKSEHGYPCQCRIGRAKQDIMKIATLGDLLDRLRGFHVHEHQKKQQKQSKNTHNYQNGKTSMQSATESDRMYFNRRTTDIDKIKQYYILWHAFRHNMLDKPSKPLQKKVTATLQNCSRSTMQ